MSNIARMPSTREIESDEFLPQEYLESRIRGEEAALSAADAIKAGAYPDVYWVEHMDEVMAELDSHPVWGKAYIHGYICTLMEEMAQ